MSKVIELSLSRIGRIPYASKKYNIFTSIRGLDELKEKLKSVDKDSKGPLSGTLCAIKDNIATKDEPTTCGSKILYDYHSPFESTVTDLLTKSGSVIVGKVNLDEFGMGDSNLFSHFGQTYNPYYDKNVDSDELSEENKYIPGGSSGGSAAAVAADLCDFALGTDTGGSVRLPAAYCGVTGFKPSYGRLSRWGVVSYAQSLDTVGIISKRIDVIQKVFDVLNVFDKKDPTSLPVELRSQFEQYVAKFKLNSQRKLNIGISRQYLAKGLSEKSSLAIKELVTKLFEKGYNVVPFEIPILPYSLPTYFTIAYAEAASNLSRFDGIRYGYSAFEDKKDTSDNYKTFISNTRTKGFGKEVQKRILLGNYNLSSERFKNNFLKAEASRKTLSQQFNDIFKVPNILYNSVNPDAKLNETGIDFIISPTSNSPAPKVSDHLRKEKESPLNSYINDAFLIPASLAGLPSISIPWLPHAEQEPVPVGIQIIGQYGDDARLLEFSKQALELNH